LHWVLKPSGYDKDAGDRVFGWVRFGVQSFLIFMPCLIYHTISQTCLTSPGIPEFTHEITPPGDDRSPNRPVYCMHNTLREQDMTR